MSKKLFVQAIVKFLAGVILVGLLVFLPAGTLSFVGGWFFNGHTFYTDVFRRHRYDV